MCGVVLCTCEIRFWERDEEKEKERIYGEKCGQMCMSKSEERERGIHACRDAERDDAELCSCAAVTDAVAATVVTLLYVLHAVVKTAPVVVLPEK